MADATTPQEINQDSSRLYVSNIPWSTDDEQLTETFAPFGAVEEARVVRSRWNNRSRGYAFVKMATSEEAIAAVKGLNGSDLGGRDITVEVARSTGPRPVSEEDGKRRRRRGGKRRGGRRRADEDDDGEVATNGEAGGEAADQE